MCLRGGGCTDDGEPRVDLLFDCFHELEIVMRGGLEFLDLSRAEDFVVHLEV